MAFIVCLSTSILANMCLSFYVTLQNCLASYIPSNFALSVKMNASKKVSVKVNGPKFCQVATSRFWQVDGTHANTYASIDNYRKELKIAGSQHAALITK